jgi:pyridoxal phosphate enzyme (YggS family)
MADIAPSSNHHDIAANLAAVSARVVGAAKAAGRDPKAVTLIAVSKGHGVDAITAALEAGHRVFGENRIQEAATKWPDLRQRYPDIELHLIGPLQTNKITDALALFDVIETLDRPRLAAQLAVQRARADAPAPIFYVQVNTGEEPQKAGVLPVEADAFIAACRNEHGLSPAGLMCIPPQGEEPSPHFAFLAKIAARHGLTHLSMGMSADFETAITFGATHVRVGTAIFGAR